MSHYRLHILVVRLSALGDVAMLQPVVKHRALANPDVLFTVAAPPMLAPLFEGVGNLHFLHTPKRQSAKSLYKHLASVNPTVVIDMHHVNRVIAACVYFRLHGVKVYSLHKPRLQRHRMVRRHCKKLSPITPMWQRYNEMFHPLHLRGEKLTPTPPTIPSGHSHRAIGIAPFAQHQGKIWPLQQMEQLVQSLAADSRNSILLFGSKAESAVLEEWQRRYPNVQSTAGKSTFADELQQIAQLDLMVSMDSSNMHFASCLGIPVVSLWGATHPALGFYGYGQQPQWAVQKELPCRPCSAYGKKPCRYGDYRCLLAITPAAVLHTINEVIPLEMK